MDNLVLLLFLNFKVLGQQFLVFSWAVFVHFFLKNFLQVREKLFFQLASSIALFAWLSLFVNFWSIAFKALWEVTSLFSNWFIGRIFLGLILSLRSTSPQELEFLIWNNFLFFSFWFDFFNRDLNFSWSSNFRLICRLGSLLQILTWEWRELIAESLSVHSLEFIVLENILELAEWWIKCIIKVVSLSWWSSLVSHLKWRLADWRHGTHPLEVVCWLRLWESASSLHQLLENITELFELTWAWRWVLLNRLSEVDRLIKNFRAVDGWFTKNLSCLFVVLSTDKSNRWSIKNLICFI